MDIHTLVKKLRQPAARTGVGVWLLPVDEVGREEVLAQRLNLYPLDLRQVYLDRLPAGALFSGLTRPDGHQKLLDVLRFLANDTHPRDCLLVHMLDLLLLGLEVDERERFWHTALDGLPYPRTKLILTLPENATHLFPYNFIQRYREWIASGSI